MIVAIVLTMAAFVLMVAEVLFPSLGLLGLISAACIVFADIVAAQVGPTFFWILLAVQVVAIPLVIKGAFLALPRLPFTRGIMLPAAPAEPEAAVPSLHHLRNAVGVALTDLRPSGTADFAGERVTVVAESGVVERATRLEVVAVEGYRVVVRPAPGQPAGP